MCKVLSMTTYFSVDILRALLHGKSCQIANQTETTRWCDAAMCNCYQAAILLNYFAYLTLLSNTLVRKTSSWSRLMVQKVQRSLCRFGPETGPRFLASPVPPKEEQYYHLDHHQNNTNPIFHQWIQKYISHFFFNIHYLNPIYLALSSR